MASFPTLVSLLLAAVFAVSGLVNLAGPKFVREAYARWHFPPHFHRVTGALEILTAFFLATPQTRIWGVVLAALVTFVAEVTLLSNRQYLWSIPGMAVMIALIPATAASMAVL